jgi:hypothetical protein
VAIVQSEEARTLRLTASVMWAESWGSSQS